MFRVGSGSLKIALTFTGIMDDKDKDFVIFSIKLERKQKQCNWIESRWNDKTFVLLTLPVIPCQVYCTCGYKTVRNRTKEKNKQERVKEERDVNALNNNILFTFLL